MSVPAIPAQSNQNGLKRSALLMHALGARGGAIWSELSPDEAGSLSAAMETLSPDERALGEAAAGAFLKEGVSETGMTSDHDPSATDIWTRVSGLESVELTAFLKDEHPQVIALVLSRLDPSAAARTLRALPAQVSLDALKRMLKLGPVHPAAAAAVETRLSETLSARPGDGHERVARIFDRLDGRSEQMLLAALENAEPGAGDRVRALMFTFDDLASLSAAGLQTLLAAADRATLIIGLKGAKPATADAFFANMTSRAGDFLREEIEALGPVRRSEIDAARGELVALARKLIQRGDIRTDDKADDELIE